MVRKIIALFVASIFSMGWMLAQGNKMVPQTLTLAECLHIATRQNLEIQQAEAQLLSAGARLTTAFGRYLPSVSLSAGYSRRLDQQQRQFINIGGQLIPVPSSPPNSYSLSLSAALPIFDGFAREAQFAQAREQLRATELQAADTRRRVLQQVYEQFLEVQKAHHLIDVRQADLEAAQTQLAKLQAQYAAGRIARPLVYQQQAQVAQKRLALIQAQNQLTQAKAKLRTLLGFAPTDPVDFSPAGLPDTITTAMIAAFRQEIGDISAAIHRALKARPDYQAARHRLAVAEEAITIARSSYFPSLSASLSWSWANSELRDFDKLGRTFVGFSLRVPLFDNFRTNEQLQSAHAQRIQQEVEVQRLEQQITAEVEQAFLQLEAAEKELEAATTALEAAQLNYTSAQNRLEVGKISLVEYTQANSQLVSARVSYWTALFNYLKAQYLLRSLVGLPQ